MAGHRVRQLCRPQLHAAGPRTEISGVWPLAVPTDPFHLLTKPQPGQSGAWLSCLLCSSQPGNFECCCHCSLDGLAGSLLVGQVSLSDCCMVIMYALDFAKPLPAVRVSIWLDACHRSNTCNVRNHCNWWYRTDFLESLGH